MALWEWLHLSFPAYHPRGWGELDASDGHVGGWPLAVCPSCSLCPLFLQRCFQTTNGYLSDSRACSSNYSVAALATASLVGRFQQTLSCSQSCLLHPWTLVWEGKGDL
jgi:hypothetical protein